MLFSYIPVIVLIRRRPLPPPLDGGEADGLVGTVGDLADAVLVLVHLDVVVVVLVLHLLLLLLLDRRRHGLVVARPVDRLVGVVDDRVGRPEVLLLVVVTGRGLLR